MTPHNDPILGIHARALNTWSRRNEVLATNIAHADTPNYKARDIDFRAVLADAEGPGRMITTHPGHQQITGSADSGSLLYRTPYQPSLDGNSVETDVEQAQFAENALRYQATLRFISGRLGSLRAAIAGRHN